MKKRYMMLICTILLLWSGCIPQSQVGHLVDMKSGETDRYATIQWEDRVYVPYCVISKGDMGKQIGIVDGDKNDRVYEYKGYSSEEWIISMYHSGEMDNPMLMKEQSVTDILEGLETEYD